MARVMIVDDEQEILDLVGEELRRLGHEVTALNQPRVALDVLGKPGNAFDLVLCDLMMPQTNGLEFADRARATPRFGGRLAFMSGLAETLGQDIQDAGVRHVLQKPFTREALHRLLRECKIPL